MKTLFASVFLVGLLAGCVQTMPQQQYRPTSADDPSIKCLSGQDVDPRFAVLIPRLGSVSRANRATIEMLASTEKPSDEEKTALSAWGAARRECVEMGRSFRAAYAPPGFNSAFEEQQNILLQEIAKLYSGSVSFGQFNVERQKLSASATAKFEELGARDRAERTQQAQREQARADAALMMMLQQQQQNRPITTNCNRFGNNVNCTTR